MTLYRAFKDTRVAIKGLQDVDESVVSTMFVNLFPEPLHPQARIFAEKLSKAEQAVIIATFYHGFHIGYGGALSDVQKNRNLHSELA